MTEEGAIKEIRENMLCDYCIAGCDECDIESCSNKDAFSVAIKALEEVQQYRKHGLTVENVLDNMCDLAAAENLIEEYRAIGTPEECRKSVDICKAMAERRISLQNMEDYMKFEDECVKRGFTFNSLLEAREKQEPKKPTDRCMYKECPACGEVEIEFCKYCPSCGQKLDWRNEE